MPKLKRESVQPIVDSMKNRGLWDEGLLKEIPLKWESYGEFLLFSYPSFQDVRWKQAGNSLLWPLVCQLYGGTKIALKGRIQNDEFRSPKIEIVFGDSPIAEFLDNGIKYSWNIEKSMFCSGNLAERHRIGSLNCENEVIVDLFAGIGYFTLPYLVLAKAKTVYACEWNPAAVEFLRRNLSINKVENRCIIREGDNRKVCPESVADRVNLGLIPTAEPFWETACQALVTTGGTLYIHQNVTSKIQPSQPLECLKCQSLHVQNFGGGKLSLPLKEFSSTNGKVTVYDMDELLTWKFREWFNFSLHLSHCILEIITRVKVDSGWKVIVTDVFKVKLYAPHIHHLVYTVKCTPTALFA